MQQRNHKLHIPKLIILLYSFYLLLTACSGRQFSDPTNNLLSSSTPLFIPTFIPTYTFVPTNTPSPTLTTTPIPSDTPNPTPTFVFPFLVGTPLPIMPEPISLENASQVIELARWNAFTEHIAPQQLTFTSEGISLVVLAYPSVENPKSVLRELTSVGGIICTSKWIGCPESETGEKICDYKLTSFRILDGKPIASLPIDNGGKRTSYLLSSDSKTIAGSIISDGCPIQLFSINNPEVKINIKPLISPVFFNFLVDGHIFWIADYSGHIHFYNTNDGSLNLISELKSTTLNVAYELLPTRDPRMPGMPPGMKERLLAADYIVDILALSPKGNYLISRIYKRQLDGGRIDLWRQNGVNHTLENPIIDSSLSAVFSPDEGFVAVKYESGEKPIKIFSSEDGRLIHTIGDSSKSYKQLLFDASGKVLIGVTDKSIELWGIDGANLLATLSVEVSQITFSPDGRFLATISEDGLVQLWGVKP
jgi:hypothetical protein